MKKILIVLGFLMIKMCFAQLNNAQYIKWGITTNFHKGSIVGVHDVSVGKYGYGAGLFADIALDENDVYDSAYLFLEPQVEYSTQGEFAKAEPNVFPTQKYYYNYVAAMLYIKWFFHSGNMRRNTYLFAGPRAEYLVSRKEDVSSAYNAGYYQFNYDATLNKFGYGVSFGAGMRFSRQFEAFIRYDRGFSTVYPDNHLRHTYNRTLCVGLNFNINQNWWY